MIINKNKCKIAFTDILFSGLSILYLVGIKLWFPVCGVSGDMVIPDERIKAGIDISGAGIAVLSMMIPGNIISLCKNSEMQCRTNTSLWTIIFMAVICAALCADAFIYLRLHSGKKHSRDNTEKSL